MTRDRAIPILRIAFWSFGEAVTINLTERRKQFLRSLMDLYHRTHLPVHYETLARRIGVSKWTAYDMLKQLEKLGFLTRDYAVRPGEMGRSQIVFVPTKQAEALFSRLQSAAESEDDLVAVKEKVLQRLRELKDLSPAKAIQKIMGEIRKMEAGVLFCAYLIGLLLICLQTLGEGTAGHVTSLLQHAPGREMRLTMFVGMVTGTVIQSIGNGLSSELVDLAGRCLKTLSSLTDKERELLADFLDEGLAAGATAG